MGMTPAVLAIVPRPLPAMVAMGLQAIAGSLLTPAIAAVSLAVAGRAALGERLGRNGRYGSIGAGVGAVVLGACGLWFPDRGVFVVAALVTVPALLALRAVHADEAASAPTHGPDEGSLRDALSLLKDRRLMVFSLCVVLFQTSSIAILQLAAVMFTARLGVRASLVIAACLILPQIVVAWLSPALGRAAERFGRRPLLLAAFACLPLRGALFALLRNPYWLVPVQTLEGASGSVFGVMLPLVSADLTRCKGHYTLCLSLLGLAGGLGTAISTALAGWVADGFGRPAAFWALAGTGLAAFLLIGLAMPETRGDNRVTTQPTRARIPS
jgi:MFS family permease